LKTLLIISPYFPPSNGADTQRIRMSLPYFKANGWQVEVITVNPKHSDINKDEFLLKSVPADIKIHQIEAFSKKWTSKFGLGSLALRSLWFYKKYVNQLLKKQHFDLIYLSTTQFPVCILGAYWKRKFNISYVIDMQDPWHSTYYEDKPKAEKPPKYWFSYRLNKYLEPIAMKKVDGIVSVSQGYVDTLKGRYKRINEIPIKVITFGAYQPDMDLVQANPTLFNQLYTVDKAIFNLVYIGRGGEDMKEAVALLFSSFNQGLNENRELFSKLRIYFIGTSYAPAGKGQSSILPIAKTFALDNYVTEITDRVPFYDGINALLNSNALAIIGSNDKQYTASKLYPYILAKKPLIALFHPESSATNIIKTCKAGEVFSILDGSEENISNLKKYLELLLLEKIKVETDWNEFAKYSAENMTKEQCELFNKVIGYD
jgi:hypothetical protein